jgi:hypothetical protein
LDGKYLFGDIRMLVVPSPPMAGEFFGQDGGTARHDPLHVMGARCSHGGRRCNMVCLANNIANAVVTDLITTAPPHRGSFILEMDLVKEGVLWFAEQSSPAVKIPLTVE